MAPEPVATPLLRLKRVFENAPVEFIREQPMVVRAYLRRFIRKFVFDVMPGALASLVGAMFFAQHWSQPAPAPRVDTERLTAQSEQINRAVQEEHALMVDFLKQVQQRDAARQPLTIAEMKAKEAAARRPVAAEPVRETRDAKAELKSETKPEPKSEPKSESRLQANLAASTPPARPSAPLVAPVPPPPDVVAIESGPLIASEPETVGLGRVTAMMFSAADKAVDLTGLRHVPGMLRTIKGETDTIRSEIDSLSDPSVANTQR